MTHALTATDERIKAALKAMIHPDSWNFSCIDCAAMMLSEVAMGVTTADEIVHLHAPESREFHHFGLSSSPTHQRETPDDTT